MIPAPTRTAYDEGHAPFWVRRFFARELAP